METFNEHTHLYSTLNIFKSYKTILNPLRSNTIKYLTRQ